MKTYHPKGRPGRKPGPKKTMYIMKICGEKYEQYTKGNELLTIQEALNEVNIRIISLLTSDIKSENLIGVSRENMEESLKALNITPCILIRRSRALWDLLMKSEQEVKDLGGSVLTSKTLRLQIEYMGTRRTNVTVHGVPIDITEDRLGAFFPNMAKSKK